MMARRDCPRNAFHIWPDSFHQLAASADGVPDDSAEFQTAPLARLVQMLRLGTFPLPGLIFVRVSKWRTPMTENLKRRDMLKTVAAGGGLLMLGGVASAAEGERTSKLAGE